MLLHDAQQRAEEILRILREWCFKAEVAGSVRRKKPDVGDIEIVALPRPDCLSKIRDYVNRTWGPPKKGPFPSRYTCIRGALDVDFFWPRLETWGLVYFIRTGSDDFARRALTHWKKITNGGFAQGAMLFKPGPNGPIHVPTPEEINVFEALQTKFVAPEKRLSKQSKPCHQRARNVPKDDPSFDFE